MSIINQQAWPFSEPELEVLALAASVSRDDNNNSAALETEGELPSPVSASRDCVSVPAVSVSEAEASPVLERGGGHQGPAEAGIVPLGLVAAPALALSDNSDCVLAESAEDGRVPLTEEAAIQSEASSVQEWGLVTATGQRKLKWFSFH